MIHKPDIKQTIEDIGVANEFDILGFAVAGGIFLLIFQFFKYILWASQYLVLKVIGREDLIRKSW